MSGPTYSFHNSISQNMTWIVHLLTSVLPVSAPANAQDSTKLYVLDPTHVTTLYTWLKTFTWSSNTPEKTPPHKSPQLWIWCVLIWFQIPASAQHRRCETLYTKSSTGSNQLTLSQLVNWMERMLQCKIMLDCWKAHGSVQTWKRLHLPVWIDSWFLTLFLLKHP